MYVLSETPLTNMQRILSVCIWFRCDTDGRTESDLDADLCPEFAAGSKEKPVRWKGLVRLIMQER